MAEQKTDGEAFAEYQELLANLEKQKEQDYVDAGTLPPGVVTRNPDTTSAEANYVSRDNIVVSGASPHNVQAAVNSLATDESRDKALDAADVAQAVTREEYDAAIVAVGPNATEAAREDAESEIVDLRDDEAHEPDAPRASGGAEVPESVLETVADKTEDKEPDGEPFDAPPSGLDGAEPEHQQESGPDAVQSDGASLGEADPGNPDATTR